MEALAGMLLAARANPATAARVHPVLCCCGVLTQLTNVYGKVRVCMSLRYLLFESQARAGRALASDLTRPWRVFRVCLPAAVPGETELRADCW